MRLMCEGRAFCSKIWSLIYISSCSITCPLVACQHPDIADTMDQNPLFCPSFNRLKDKFIQKLETDFFFQWKVGGLIVHKTFLEPEQKNGVAAFF